MTAEEPLFFELDEAVKYVRHRFHEKVDEHLLSALEKFSVLPSYGSEQRQFLRADIESIGPLFGPILDRSVLPEREDLFTPSLPHQVLVGSALLPFGREIHEREDPSVMPALRALVGVAAAEGGGALLEEAPYISWLGGASLQAEGRVAELARVQVARHADVELLGATDFARTAYYMGTKRDLGPFLVEAVATVLPREGVVLDVMCGSGAAAGAFAREWETYASDAQSFCRNLAMIQGGGYSRQRAVRCVRSVLERARAHEELLRNRVESLLRREMELCHSDVTEELLNAFREYVQDVPTFPSAATYGGWDPRLEVEARRQDAKKTPYCLVTSYFSTVYFGLRQAVEVDSIRYAIDQLEDGVDRSWALGALVVAASVRATTYAAHFAQPKVRDFGGVTLRQLAALLEGWSSSIYHEFAVRLERLGLQSESSRFAVSPIDGPWQVGLREFRQKSGGRAACVYLDAPYTREEYSRYYHVLETLVRYDYPSAIGVGRIPSKAKGERFSSELFTRTRGKVEDHLVAIIEEILSQGWICAWSYSDAGRARIPDVIRRVVESYRCRVRSFVAPHRYQAQRGRKPRDVKEYLVLFVP